MPLPGRTPEGRLAVFREATWCRTGCCRASRRLGRLKERLLRLFMGPTTWRYGAKFTCYNIIANFIESKMVTIYESCHYIAENTSLKSRPYRYFKTAFSKGDVFLLNYSKKLHFWGVCKWRSVKRRETFFLVFNETQKYPNAPFFCTNPVNFYCV